MTEPTLPTTISDGDANHEDHHETLHDWHNNWRVPGNARMFLPGDFVTSPAAADSVRYLSGAGSDANDGLTAGTPKLTLAAAYSALPSSGGTIFCAPGRYDVGSGFAILRQKPCQLVSTVPPLRYVTSTSTAPISVNAPVLYSSTGAASLVTTIGGTAAARCDGLRFIGIVFELSNAATTIALDINSCSYGEVSGCYFFADKTSGSPGPAPVAAQGMFIRATTPGTYGGDDCSWWRVDNNACINMALGTFGNTAATFYNNNHQLISRNIGLGLTHTNTSALPFIRVFRGFRISVENNNIEAYNIGVRLEKCHLSRFSGDGGEFVDVFYDLYDTKTCLLEPLGISSQGTQLVTALLVRGDSFTKANVIVTPATWTAYNGVNNIYEYNPTDDPTHPAVSLGSTDNEIITSRNRTHQGVRDLVGTGTPESAVVGSIGDTFFRTDGGIASTIYVKESGTATNTGWKPHGLPSQSGNNGLFLTTNGTTPSWATAPGAGAVTVPAVVATDQTLTSSSTTLQNVTNLGVTIPGDSTSIYYVETLLAVNTANATMDFKWAWTVPAGCTGYQAVHGGNTNLATSPLGPQTTATTIPNTAGLTTSILVGSAAGLWTIAFVAWIFDGGTGGTVQLQAAQNTSDAGAITVKKGSFLRVTRVV